MDLWRFAGSYAECDDTGLRFARGANCSAATLRAQPSGHNSDTVRLRSGFSSKSSCHFAVWSRCRTSSSDDRSVVLHLVGGEARRVRCSSRFLGVGCI